MTTTLIGPKVTEDACAGWMSKWMRYMYLKLLSVDCKWKVKFGNIQRVNTCKTKGMAELLGEQNNVMPRVWLATGRNQ